MERVFIEREFQADYNVCFKAVSYQNFMIVQLL